MEQYILKSALLAEIEKKKKLLPWGSCASQISMECNCKNEAYDDVISLLDTLEVKEILSLQEEPVNEELEEAAQQWYDSTKFKSDLSGTPIGAFKAGASWKKEEMMKDTVDAFIYKGNIRLKEWPLPEKYGKHLDSVKLIITKENKDE